MEMRDDPAQGGHVATLAAGETKTNLVTAQATRLNRNKYSNMYTQDNLIMTQQVLVVNQTI